MLKNKLFNKVKKFFRERKIETLKAFGENLPEGRVRYTLCGVNPEITSNLVEYFHDLEYVEIKLGDILRLDTDALISPANSFGEMSGGLDKAIDDFYEGNAQKQAEKVIREKYYGELTVGNAEILSMKSERFPYLVCAPSMRIPGKLSQESFNAYLAMRASLIAIKEFNQRFGKIMTVAIPSFCTGVGGMDPKTSAKQMRQAFDMIEGNKFKEIVHPSMAPQP